MSTPDINSLIVDVLVRHQPMSRKEIHDHLPPGTYGKQWSLSAALDNISQRLNTLEKKDRIVRAGNEPETGIILWTVPGMPTAEEPAAAPIETESAAETVRDERPESKNETATARDGLPPVQNDPLCALDDAFNVIRAAVIEAMESKDVPMVRHKTDTLEALRCCAAMLEPVAINLRDRIVEVIDIVEQLDEEMPC